MKEQNRIIGNNRIITKSNMVGPNFQKKNILNKKLEYIYKKKKECYS
jgi:hypothetical protein